MEHEPTTPPGAETTPPAAPPVLGGTAPPPTSPPSSSTGALGTTAPVMTSAAVAVKREPGTGDSGGYNPNQNQAQFNPVKQEIVASAHHDIMNQSAAHSSPKLLPSFSFPPFVPPSSSSSSPHSTSPPLSALAPSLFPSSTSSTSSSPSSLPLPPLSHSPAMATPPSAMQSRLAPAPSVPLATSPSSWEQQTLARLNSLTQMTSQIASIALEKTAAKTEAVVEDNPESVVEWVTSISRSLQTELQSVYLTLHSGPAEPLSVLGLPATASAAVPTSTLTPALLAPSPASPSVSPLSLSPSLPSFVPGQHLLVQTETVPTPVLMGSPTPLPLAASTEGSGESKKGRRRRKTKTKDSFNHMQRKCASCQRTETTKWRHGPLGSNTLCNTCGLAYSRKKKREAEQAAKLGAAATDSTPSP